MRLTKFEREQREWFRQRLDDKKLLDRAVRLIVDGRRFHDIAVPVGGSRRGGEVACCSISWAKQVYRQLENKPGFPHLRIEYSPYREACHSVVWGGLSPESGDRARGRFYGYRESVLGKYENEP
jgi:hypothetical protein